MRGGEARTVHACKVEHNGVENRHPADDGNIVQCSRQKSMFVQTTRQPLISMSDAYGRPP